MGFGPRDDWQSSRRIPSCPTIGDIVRQRQQIRIRGTVQGVGFRPFVANLAHRLGISGFVRNTEGGVEIEAEGEGLESFLAELRSGAPPLARIAEIEVRELADGETRPSAPRDFEIRHSAAPAGDYALVPPDIATCEDCRRDSTEPGNRRYHYPFTNCTNCGPRYTIIRDVPYDRAATTMAEFQMCETCETEYRDATDRRFHAQPNACPVCGPRISATLDEVRAWLRAGEVVAIKGLGGYHLACDASNGEAVDRLRTRKRRGGKPFAVMVRSLEEAERLCQVSEAERALLSGARRPIALLRKKPAGELEGVAPRNPNLGVMLPYTPLHHLLFEGADFGALVMTSGNLSEEPIVSREEELPRLGGLADRFLSHNRPIRTAVDDSVVRVFRGRPMVLRRSRGCAPAPVDLGHAVPDVAAAGGELKNTFCLTTGRYAILSQHIGDLENYETLVFFRETLDHMRRFFRVKPQAVAHDLHPGYLSTRAAREMELPLIGVQHHHAHAASCMAEHRLEGRTIGVAFDGTGYGTDGAIWGGEVLVCDYTSFERRYHLRYVPLAGGDAGAREPWRCALAYLRDAGLGPGDAEALTAVDERRLRTVETMIERRVQTVDTSSCGRLFDAVSALLGVCLENRYEAEAAMELEAAAEGEGEPFGFELRGEEIDLRQAIAELVSARRKQEATGILSARFHSTIARAIAAACESVRATDGLRQVCLSGGSFQNVRLLEGTIQELERGGFEVYWHSEIPPNDGGIALGQAAVACARIQGML
jgi:hydrogenase maturation protein HypF